MPSEKQQTPITKWTEQLRKLVDIDPSLQEDLSGRQAAKIQADLATTIGKLKDLSQGLDPVKLPGKVFNPADPAAVGAFIGMAMLAQPRRPLGEVGKFYGSGVYAIYYTGDFNGYEPLSGAEHPIYVGKADPKDPKADSPVTQGTKLADRLNEHAKNIRKATTTLKIEDFECRYLVITSGWQGSAENFLIRLYEPIWNNETGICHGLGKHGDSDDTRANKRSPWDTLHPGRAWAANAKAGDQFPPNMILKNLAEHFSRKQPAKNHKEAFNRFFETLR